METLFFNGLHGFKKDDDSKTIYLNKNHLKESQKKILRMGDGSLYHIGYSSVKVYIKNMLKGYEEQGYKIMFEHEGKNVLLRFNR